jgi:uncharacterized protein Yka (UPF0111/DUF47 family)
MSRMRRLLEPLTSRTRRRAPTDRSPGRARVRTHRVVDPLLRQIECARQGVRISRGCASGQLDSGDAMAEISAVEHSGDDARSDLVHALASSLVTPLDREDLFRLSRHLDDVLDELRDVVGALDLFRLPADLGIDLVFDGITAALDGLERTIGALSDGDRAAAQHALSASKSISVIRRLQRRTFAELFADAESLPGRAVLMLEAHRQVDRVISALDGAASTLADGLIKRG